jgi:hypothetical protein
VFTESELGSVRVGAEATFFIEFRLTVLEQKVFLIVFQLAQKKEKYSVIGPLARFPVSGSFT